jgi:release factor glutamine methyltransferase
MIYKPREDSYLLEKYVKKLVKGKVLDVGTGSGILALAALENTKDILAVDIDNEAVELVRKKGINAVISDLFEKVGSKFDWVIFNPPYLPEDGEEDEESKIITTGGKKGYELIEKFFSEVGNYLNKDGRILIVFSSLSGDVGNIIRKYGFKFRVLEEKKLFFEKLFVVEVWK